MIILLLLFIVCAAYFGSIIIIIIIHHHHAFRPHFDTKEPQGLSSPSLQLQSAAGETAYVRLCNQIDLTVLG